jgi:PTS system N-acetylglucosamine-specific IIC component
MKRLFASVQSLGRALMLPIAVLPVAGLLMRIGQPDLLAMPMIAAAGEAIFANLGILFAIGVAVGLARENHGAAGLAGLVGYLVTTKGAEVLLQVPPGILSGLEGEARDLAGAAFKARELAKLSVPAGILSGVIAGVLYNRYSDIRLPSYLAFFGGRRFVPIASGFVGLIGAAAFGYGWPILETGMDGLSRAVLGSGEIGLFLYGVLNRVLIVTGLHHVINNLAWFLVGDFNGVTGDLKRYFAGDPSAGAFMSGFFPVMMFGLPAACYAMYRAARPERRRAVGGLLASMALTSFLTGVTEPIEFTFMFLAPLLYAVHAVLTGIAMVVMDAFDVRLGFSFSAGLFDFVLNLNRATNPWLLLPIGAIYSVLYYGLFRLCIARFDLKTPGREPVDAAASERVLVPESDRALAFVKALGGAANLLKVDACTTRLRLEVKNHAAVNTDALKDLGARGTLRLSENALQVVLGPIADQVAGEMRAALRGEGAGNSAQPADAARVTKILAALGGRANVRTVELASTRLRVAVVDDSSVDEDALRSIGTRGVARPRPGLVHVIVGPAAGAVHEGLVLVLANTN